MAKKVIVFVMMLTLIAFAAANAKGKTKGHPEKMGSQDCLECHVDVTPELTAQWEQSAHGFTGVKCQVCHGDEKNFRKTPLNETCQGCHSHQVDNNTSPKTACATCHKAHNFAAHKAKDYTPTDVK